MYFDGSRTDATGSGSPGARAADGGGRAAGTRESAAAPSGSIRPRILVVDDSALARRALSLTLEAAGFDVTTAESAREAHARITRHEPGELDVILMDLHLPDGTGIEACAAIKRRTGWHDVPVIVVTSSDDDRDLAQAFAAGATDYITKPPREIELLARVRAALRLRLEMARRQARERELELLNRRLTEQTIELSRTREALETLNHQLEQRVHSQVDEIMRRAREVDALNAQLRAQVRERSRELAEALRRLAGQWKGRTLETGAVLNGRIRLVRRLAAGGMGVVYAGVDLASDTPVAVKALDPSLRVTARDLQRLFEEASAASAVDHPAIVRIEHVDVSGDGDPYLVMELVTGVALDRLLLLGTLSSEWCISVGRLIADALAAAHEAGIIHRDIKPSNLMVCPEAPGVRLLDFGISKVYGAGDGMTVTHTGHLLGTPAYMAPEQLEHAADVTAATDIYSLGLVMFEMIAGPSPFRFDPRGRPSPGDVLSLLRERAPHAPEPLAVLISRSLAPNPPSRPSARRLADDLASLMSGMHVRPPHVLFLSIDGAAQGMRS